MSVASTVLAREGVQGLVGVPAVVLGPAGLVHDAVSSVLWNSGLDLLDALAGTQAPDVTVLVEPTKDHWAAAEALGAPVLLVVGGGCDRAVIVDAVLRGAEAVLNVDAAPGALLSAILAVVGGGSVLDPVHVRAVIGIARAAVATPSVRLTPREVEIMQSIAKGHVVKQTARSLGISTKTVENLQTRLFRKLGVHNRAQAVAQAHALGAL